MITTLVIGDCNSLERGRDIIVNNVATRLTPRIPVTHTDFIPLQYSLLFLYVEDRFQEIIPYREPNGECVVIVREHGYQ